jgi:hypothetical protein
VCCRLQHVQVAVEDADVFAPVLLARAAQARQAPGLLRGVLCVGVCVAWRGGVWGPTGGSRRRVHDAW